MKNEPSVSVIIPVYNRVNLIQETLQSIIAQTYPYWEAIVVDDGSTDGSYESVVKLSKQDQRIKALCRDREPKGAPTCRNIGASKSVGQFLIFLDSDDLLAPFCLEQRIHLFQTHKDLHFIVLPTLLFNNEVNDLKVQWNVDTTEDDLLRFLGVDALWPIVGPTYKREVFLDLGGFQEELPFWQDFDLHIRCLLKRLTYRKFFNHSPDNYVRKNYKDSISRTISYTKDKGVLQRRIDFYHSVVVQFHDQKLEPSGKQKYVIWSVFFFLCVGYLKEHNDYNKFSNELSRATNVLSIGRKSYLMNLIHGFLIGKSRANIFFKVTSKLYFFIFRPMLANYRIIFQRSLGKIPLVDKKPNN